MKTLLITLNLAAFFTLSGRSQDSLYYVHLQNGTTVYSKKVTLVNSLNRARYLLLDSNRHIALGDVRDFKGWEGTYAVGVIGGYYDVFRLQNEGRRISLYSKCYYETETFWSSAAPGEPQTPTTITTREKAWFFRKEPDGAVERVTIPNLRTAVADNAASLAQVKVAGTNLHVAIGLLAAGAATTIAGVIVTHQRNTDAYNNYKQQSAAWYASGNANAPMPTLPHYGLSPLFYVGSAMVLSGFIPILNVRKHLVKALDIYNGNE
ncbi:MAG TPA: hypothetical protein VMH27_00625 [Puia sp.]|nr:hypothetical protein [Puia sp.]